MFNAKPAHVLWGALVLAGGLAACGDDTTYYTEPAADGSGQDKTPPQIANVGSTSSTSVVISFTEPVGNGAENPANYQITRLPLCADANRDGVRLGVTAAVLNADKTAVTLTTLPQSEFTYRVGVTNVADLAGNQIEYPEFQVNPLRPQFFGTPSSGVRIDSDGDGLSDGEEQFGWAVRVTLANGAVVCRDVTSDPNVVDSDGDGLNDAEEQNRITNPRDDDTDADTLSDYDEAYVYWSSYISQDTDGDTLRDRDEVKIFKTSPAMADSDGDSYTDFEEIFQRSSNPLVADLPQAALELVGDSVIKLNVKYTDGTTFTTSVEDSFANEKAFSTQKTDTTVQKMTGLKDFAFNPVGFISGMKTLFTGGGFNDLNKMFQETTSTTTQTTSYSYRNAHADYVASSQNHVEEVSSGFIKMGMQVRNTGDIAFTLQNLSVTVLQRDPFAREATRVLATLKPGVPSLTLGPGGETGPLVVEETAAPATLIKEILANPSGLMFEVATFDLVDDDGRNFAFLSEVTHSRTALLTIDHGDGRILRYRVATDVKRNIDGTSAGVTMGEVLQNILGIDYETEVGDALLDSGSTSNEEVLIRVEDTATDLNEKKFWIVIGSRGGHVAAGQDFDDIVLKGGDNIILAYVTDKDGDGLIARHEFLFGTQDTEPDTDGDGLTDYEEVKLGWIVTTDEARRVYSDPRSADSDRDGLLDPFECGADINGIVQRDSEGNLICPVASNPNNFDTDGDTLCDGPGRLDNLDATSPYYICRLGAPQDPKPTEPALFTPPSLLAVTPLPNDMNVSPASELTIIFDQKMAPDSSFKVHGSMTGFLAGDLGYGRNPDGSLNPLTFNFSPSESFKPGEELEITLNAALRNIDDFPLSTSYVYRFRTAVTDTGTGGEFVAGHAYFMGCCGVDVALVDLDGDGDLDAVHLNDSEDSVAVALNQGDGSYGEPFSYAVGENPRGLDYGDFDGDGDVDLVCANVGTNDLSVLLNNGNGTFAQASSYPVGDPAFNVVVGDMDGDGDKDLVTVVYNYYVVDIKVLANDGTGVYGAATSYPAYARLGYDAFLVLNDLDSDGDLDVALTHYWSGIADVSIMLNRGDGSLEIAPNHATGSVPYQVAAGDLDGDGNVDLVSANRGGDDVSVLLSNGDGSYAAPVAYAAGTAPISILLEDLDGDTDLDVVTLNVSSENISVLMNNGNATFSLAAAYAVGGSPTSIVAADLDGDGDADLAISNAFDDNISVLFNNGNGGFAAAINYPVGGAPNAMVAVDVDGDADVDLAVTIRDAANANISNVAVLLNDGAGGYAAAVNYALGDYSDSIAAGDLDGDGDIDLLAAGSSSTTDASLFLNNGAGSFAASAALAMGEAQSRLALTDLDGDGDLDLVAMSTSYGLSLSFNIGSAGFSAPVRYSALIRSVTTTDLDGDGDVDIVAPNFVGDTVTSYENEGAGTFLAARAYPAGDSAAGIATLDVNADGASDLVVSNTASDDVSLLIANGDGSFALPVQYPVGEFPISIASVDLDADGDQDVAVLNNGSQDVSILMNNGDGTLAPAMEYVTRGQPLGIAAGDVDADGDMDLAMGSENSRYLSILSNTGSGTFNTPPRYALGAGRRPREVGLGDLDGDGDLDVVTTNDMTNNLSILLNNGDGSLAAAVNHAINGDANTSMVLADLDGDGDLDVVTSNHDSDNISVMFNNGAGTFTTAVNYAAADRTYRIKAADLDADGDLDLVVGSLNSSNLLVFFNRGDGLFLPAVNVPIASSASDLINVGDFDGDGDLDLVATHTPTDAISVILNNGDGSFAAPVSYAMGGYAYNDLPVGDLDGDGDLDLAYPIITFSGATPNYGIAVMLNNGDGTLQPPIANDLPEGAQALTMGDWDGDGDIDLIGANGTVSVLLNNGNARFPRIEHYAVGEPLGIAPGDLDGDGDLDLVVGLVDHVAVVKNEVAQ